MGVWKYSASHHEDERVGPRDNGGPASGVFELIIHLRGLLGFVEQREVHRGQVDEFDVEGAVALRE